MDFDRLRAFVWTVDEGSVSRAAERLHRTQPAVTRLIQTLEDHVGRVLIDRAARPLAPTPEGRELLVVARRILELADQLPGAEGLERVSRIVLRLGIARGLLWQLGTPAFASIASAHGDVDFQVRPGWSTHVYDAFCRKELDAAILLMPDDWSVGTSPHVMLVRHEPLVVIAARDATSSAHGKDDWILNPEGCGFRARLAQEHARRGERLHVRFEVDAAAQDHIALVASGLGRSIVPRSALRHHPLRARVRQLGIGKGMGLAVWLLLGEAAREVPGLQDRLIQLCRTTSTTRHRTWRPRAATA